MLRVYRFEGKEIFINPDHIMFVEFLAGGGYDKDSTQVTMDDGETYRLSGPSYEVLTGETGPRKTQGKAGFDVGFDGL